MTSPLHEYLTRSAERHPERTAVREPDGAAITYRELATLAGRARDRLAALGVGRGDRVGIHLHKSIDSVAMIFGILECGAAYVPVDPTAPASRNGYIFADCSVKALVIEGSAQADVVAEMARVGARTQVIATDGVGGGVALRAALDRLEVGSPAAPTPGADSDPDDLAYILYTSGSTGKPKGVMLSHRNATSFVEWCRETLAPAADDVFSSHAPFHFDLSILDLYTPLSQGATLVLISEDVGKEPLKLAQLIARERITVWYSTPSILSLLVQYGKLEAQDCASLRWVLFAGEVFPIVHLRALKRNWPRPRYGNLYGPTETNVCTWYEVPKVIPDDRTEPYPIGRVCSHLEARVVDAGGTPVRDGEEGELLIRGPGVTRGYWNLASRPLAPSSPRATARAGTVPATWWRRTRAATFDSWAATTAWSRSAATGWSWERSRPGSTGTRRSARRRWWRCRMRRVDSRCARISRPGTAESSRSSSSSGSAPRCSRTTWSRIGSRSTPSCPRRPPTRPTINA